MAEISLDPSSASGVPTHIKKISDSLIPLFTEVVNLILFLFILDLIKFSKPGSKNLSYLFLGY